MKIVGTTITGSVLVNGNDVTTNLQTLNIWSGSVASTIVSLNSTTSSLNNATASLLNYTASQNNINGTYTTTSSFNAFTASQNNNNSKYATTGSNTFVGTQYVSNTTQATSFIATASLYTDGGLRVGKDAYISGSTYVAGNLVVFGTSSIQYVTSSALIGLEYIDLNTDLPSLIFITIDAFDGL
jgi:phospholipase/lecithinase/hemolysin